MSWPKHLAFWHERLPCDRFEKFAKKFRFPDFEAVCRHFQSLKILRPNRVLKNVAKPSSNVLWMDGGWSKFLTAAKKIRLLLKEEYEFNN